jgi:predicted helicase
MWDDYPDRWGVDCGIDIIFKHKNGETWAVQAKCYSVDYDVTKQDIDKFLSESNRKCIDKRLLIATTDRIGSNARQVCEAQEKPVVCHLLSNFEAAFVEYPQSITDLDRIKAKDKPQPRPHQVDAIKAVVRSFQDTDRGQLIMACGTGKTFTTLWIKEGLLSTSTLVLLPSLGLVTNSPRVDGSSNRSI